jgi:aryl-alcohol dehydrogenase-like predicted oxidoreductase
MQYRHFPALNRDLSRLVLGSMVFSREALELTYALLDAWVAVGGNMVDTAHVYSGGDSERALGLWLRERGRREDLVILSKGAHHNADRRRVTQEDITCDLRDSLARLHVETIDLYLLHRDDPEVPVGTIVEALNEHRRAGRIRAFGGSNWSTRRLAEANAYAAERGLEGFTASSPNLSLAVQSEPVWADCLSASDPDSRAWYDQAQMPLFAWSSQAGGFFTGLYSPENTENETIVRVYYHPDNWERLRRAAELGKQRGFTANQVALAWVLHQPFPTYALIGPHSVEELHSSVAALELSLTAEEVRWLNLEEGGSQFAARGSQPDERNG